jgi:hypothetical protein
MSCHDSSHWLHRVLMVGVGRYIINPPKIWGKSCPEFLSHFQKQHFLSHIQTESLYWISLAKEHTTNCIIWWAISDVTMVAKEVPIWKISKKQWLKIAKMQWWRSRTAYPMAYLEKELQPCTSRSLDLGRLLWLWSLWSHIHVLWLSPALAVSRCGCKDKLLLLCVVVAVDFHCNPLTTLFLIGGVKLFHQLLSQVYLPLVRTQWHRDLQ